MSQILSVTCDNASPNDVMIDRLAELVVAFLGAANRMVCFTHILNLVVKVFLRQFDVPKELFTLPHVFLEESQSSW